MAKKNKETPVTATPVVATQVAVTEPAAAPAASLVDDVFDAVTAWAAQGLTVAKNGLEISARWLDGRAKVVGDLATKLASSSRTGARPSSEAEAS